MAKIINKGLLKENSKLLLNTSLIGPVMVYPHIKDKIDKRKKKNK